MRGDRASPLPNTKRSHPTARRPLLKLPISSPRLGAMLLAAVGITSSLEPFSPASVKPGGRVVWTNNTLMLHTVTSD